MIHIIRILEKRANEGDVYATCKLGFYYATGHFVKKDIKKAIEYYKSAAKKGYSPAMYNLGNIFYEGVDVDKNHKIAFEWYEKGAKLGDTKCLNAVGYMYQFGYGVERDEKKAFKYYDREAKKGNAEAMFNLACVYNQGIGTEQNEVQAYKWLKKSAKKGFKEACVTVGEDALFERNYQKAMYFLKIAEKKGSGTALNILAIMYLYGTGVKQSFNKSAKLFEDSVKKGKKQNIYYVNIFKKIGDKKVLQIQSVADIIGNIIYDDVGAILIRPDRNENYESHTLYDIKTFKKIVNKTERFLEGIPLVKDDKSNEFYVFEKICERIADLVLADYSAIEYDTEYATKKYYSSRNLIGALLEGKCLCGGFAELLRNLCACRGLECIYVRSDNHAFVQIKLNEKWYYFDLTYWREEIKNRNSIKHFLLSYKKFISMRAENIPLTNQYTYDAPYNYIDIENGIRVVAENGIKKVTSESIASAEEYMDNAMQKKEGKKQNVKHGNR